MEGLRLMKAVPAPGMAMGCEAGTLHRRPRSTVGALGPRAAPPGGGSAMETSSATAPVASRPSYVFPLRIRRLWPGGGGGIVSKGSEVAAEEEKEKKEDAEIDEEEVAEEEVLGASSEKRRGNWVQNILKVGMIWAGKEEKAANGNRGNETVEEGETCADVCEGCAVGSSEEVESMVFDRESFSQLLRRVTLTEARLFAKMAYLGSLAYTIPEIKRKGLLKCYGLRFVTSSLDKKSKSLTSQDEQIPIQDQNFKEDTILTEGNNEKSQNCSDKRKNVSGINDFAAYRIAASAASYLQSRTKGILPFGSAKPESRRDSTEESKEGDEKEEGTLKSIKEVSFRATTNSVTAVVAGKEEMKDAVAKDLNSSKTSPCEWFICDDDKSSTRYFVIQGSETLASWQANLLFEPVQFEGLEVLVHRGIYEIAKGMYQQMLPEIKAHLESYGGSATLRFTGHSLGGSLALLLNLMLIIRGEAPASSLLPVVTFGSPCILCGGDHLLRKLGLPGSHVQAITLHRDIVPRAFACHYPDHVAKILKAVNPNFRHHPCLMNQKLLYAPTGRLLILQPEDKLSPHHHLLPPGSGLYILGNSSVEADDSRSLLQAAQLAFINSPHPLEILSDRSAYGSEGTLHRDHDLHSYLRSIRSVIRQDLKLIRRAKRERRRKVWWPLLTAQGIEAGVSTGNAAPVDSSHRHFSIASILPGGRESIKLFRWLVETKDVHLLILVSFPIITLGNIVCC